MKFIKGFFKFLLYLLGFILLVLLFIFFPREQNEDLNHYYPNGFGYGHINNVMNMFEKFTPKENYRHGELIPIFYVHDRKFKKHYTSYELLSPEYRELIGFENNEDFINYILEKNPNRKYRSSISSEFSPKGRKYFTLINITVNSVSPRYDKMNIYHELQHYLMKFNDYNDIFDGFESNVKSEFERNNINVETNGYYDSRSIELFAILLSVYQDNTRLNEESLSKIIDDSIYLQKTYTGVSKNRVQAMLYYDVNTVISFYQNLKDKKLDIECDDRCIMKLFVQSPEVIKAEAEFLAKTDYFNQGSHFKIKNQISDGYVKLLEKNKE